MDVEKIIIVEEEEEFPAIARLVELGRQKGYITLDDILHFFPEAGQDVEQLDQDIEFEDSTIRLLKIERGDEPELYTIDDGVDGLLNDIQQRIDKYKAAQRAKGEG